MFGRLSKATKDGSARASDGAMRCTRHLQETLSDAQWKALGSDACRRERTALIAATATFLVAMEGFGGSPSEVTAINEASQGYLRAYLDAGKLAAELADVS